MSQSVDIVVLVALKEERQGVLRHFNSSNEIHLDNFRCDAFELTLGSGRKLGCALVCLNKMGNTSSALAAQKVITAWQPGLICLTGITGGIKKEGRLLGDVIVPTQLVAYEAGVVKPGDTERRFEVYRPQYRALSAAEGIAELGWASSMTASPPDDETTERTPKAHFGVMASGEKVVRSDEMVAELLKAWPELVGIEMESTGLAQALYHAGKAERFLVVKGISDWADPDKNDKWRAYAIDAATAFLAAVLRSLPDTTRDERKRKHQAFMAFKNNLNVKDIQNLYIYFGHNSRRNPILDTDDLLYELFELRHRGTGKLETKEIHEALVAIGRDQENDIIFSYLADAIDFINYSFFGHQPTTEKF